MDTLSRPALPAGGHRQDRMRCLYDKLGAHRRPEAIEQVGALGLLALPQLLGTTPATAARRYRNKP